MEERIDRRKGKVRARKQCDRREPLRDIRGGERMYWNESVHGPVAFATKLKLLISCRGPEPNRKNTQTSSQEQEDVDAHIYLLVWHKNRKYDSLSMKM